MQDELGYSEANTLTSCERKWSYIYGKDEVEESQALYKGTALHQLIAGWETGDETAAYVEMQAMIDRGELDEATAAETDWLFDRYKRFYGASRLRVIVNELPLRSRIPGTRTWFSTRGADAIVQVPQEVDPEHAGLWHLERKTMKDWQRLIVLPVDQQVTTVQWLLREAGWPIRGTIFDAIRTYRFVDVKPTLVEIEEQLIAGNGDWDLVSKKALRDKARELQVELTTEAPLEDSFRRLWLTRTPAQIDGQLDELRRVAGRWRALRRGELPTRNLDRQCGWCHFKEDCWHSLETNSDVRLIDSVRARAAR